MEEELSIFTPVADVAYSKGNKNSFTQFYICKSYVFFFFLSEILPRGFVNNLLESTHSVGLITSYVWKYAFLRSNIYFLRIDYIVV